MANGDTFCGYTDQRESWLWIPGPCPQKTHAYNGLELDLLQREIPLKIAVEEEFQTLQPNNSPSESIYTVVIDCQFISGNPIIS